MKHLTQSKKTIIFAAFLAVMSVSLASSSQAKALSISDILNGLTDGSQQAQPENQNFVAPNQSTVVLPANPILADATLPPMQTVPVLPAAEEVILPAQITPEIPVVKEPIKVVAPTVIKTPAPAQLPAAAQRSARTSSTSPAGQSQTRNNISYRQSAITQPQVIQPVATRNVAVLGQTDTSAGVISTAGYQSVSGLAANGMPYSSNKINPGLARVMLFMGVAAIAIGALIYAATLMVKNRAQKIAVKNN